MRGLVVLLSFSAPAAASAAQAQTAPTGPSTYWPHDTGAFQMAAPEMSS